MACFFNDFKGSFCFNPFFARQREDEKIDFQSQCSCELMEHCLSEIEKVSPDEAIKAWKLATEILVVEKGVKNFPGSKVPPVDPDPLCLEALAEAEADMTEEEWRESLRISPGAKFLTEFAPAPTRSPCLKCESTKDRNICSENCPPLEEYRKTLGRGLGLSYSPTLLGYDGRFRVEIGPGFRRNPKPRAE